MRDNNIIPLVIYRHLGAEAYYAVGVGIINVILMLIISIVLEKKRKRQ
ncbi:hypothetical protein [Oceanobacillus sp. 1P07AA]